MVRMPEQFEGKIFGEEALDGRSEPTNDMTPSGAAAAAPARVADTEDDRAERERELVELARQGDKAAFGELIERHYKPCLKLATSIIRNATDAEDEVQNACWKAFQRLNQFRGDGTFSAWLSRIVENQCLMRLRQERQSRFLYLDESSESNTRLELVGQTLDPEDDLGDRQVESLLKTEISRIPFFLRQAMLLRDVERLSMSDVAARLGLTVPAAKSRLGRARVEMRLRLKKHFGRRGQSTLTRKSSYSRVAYTRGDSRSQ
jgi:RNA polymerase sigma-70 factor, ECF subfamily